MQADQRVAGIVLAAGESRRFGSPKQLALLDGRTLLEHALDTGAAAGLRPLVVVVPVWLSRPASLSVPDLHWLRNPHPQRGLSYSLRLALQALGPEVEAAIVLLGDQPRVPASQLAALLAARGPRPIVASRAAGLLAPPILLERRVFALADALEGETGLRDVLRERAELVTAVDVAAHAPDVDTVSDLGRLTGL